MVLAAVTLRPFAPYLVPQSLPEHCQVADVVAAQQVIRGIVRLEVSRQGPPDALGEQGLVTVQKAVGLPALPQLQNGLAHGVQGVGGQHVVVVRQGQVLPGGQLGHCVGVGGDALIFDLFVYNSFIFRLIFLYDLAHLGVCCIGGISQAQLPVGGRLPHKGI